MDKKQMQLEALESMTTGRVGYFWDNLESGVATGRVSAIYPSEFEKYNSHDWHNFSLMDPRPSKHSKKIRERSRRI